MNQKQLLILVVVLAVLGGAALMLLKRDADTRQGAGRSEGAELLADLPVGEELAQVSITQGANTLTLAKSEGAWGVTERRGYPANYAEISRLVLKLRELKPAQTEQVTESQLARLELLPPGTAPGSGTLIEFRDQAGERLGELLLGKEQTTQQDAPPSQFGPGGPRDVPVGRWVMNPEKKSSAALVSDTLSNIQPTPGAWLNKDFFKVQKIKSIEVSYPDDTTNSFKLSRETETGDWTLAGLEAGWELDTSKTSGFNYALSNPSFEDVIVNGDAVELGLDQPTWIKIETFQGFHYEIQAGEKTNNSIAMRVAVKGTYPREREATEDEDDSVTEQKDKEFAAILKTSDEKLEQEQALENWTFLVSSWTLDSVLKKRSDLVNQRETEEAADPVEGLLDLPSAE